LFQGQLDPPLDGVGRAQADAAAPVLAALKPVSIVTSDLDRAATTAAVLAKVSGLVPTADRRLRELDLGAWQGLDRDTVAERFPEEYAAWVSGIDVRRSGGETYAEVGERGSVAVLEALHRAGGAGPVVAVTHGGTARATIGVLLGLDPATWSRLGPLGNCRWSVLVEGDAGWRLVEHNAGVPDVAVVSEERAGDDAR